jgi:hypothetical protein
MKSIKDHEFDMNLSVRTERGKCAIELGLDHLNPAEREFVFSSVAGTLKGGEAQFGMRTTDTGEIVIEITLSGPNLRKPANKAVKAALVN